MARTLKWGNRIPAIREQIANSVVESWTRRDIERVFELKRAAAQQLIRAVGEVQNIGGVHLVNRASLLSFLDQLAKADSPEAVRREKLQLAEPVPRPRFLKNTVPEDLRSIMVRDLPPEIVLDHGRLEITGANAEEVFQRLVLLAQAVQNDLNTAADMLDPPPVPLPASGEFQEMLAGLRRRENTLPV